MQTLRAAIKNRIARRLNIPGIPFALERLRTQGFIPSTVFDVGAYRGDFADQSLKVWPQAKILCFEPQPHMQARLRALGAKTGGMIQAYDVLLGATQSDGIEFHCAETASSVLPEHHQQHPSIVCRQTTLDAVTARLGEDLSPALLKIDVQGYELEVLKGAEKSLVLTEAILAEVNLLDIHAGVSLMAELIGWLNQRNFVAFDVCDFVRRPLDRALWQLDMIFVRRDGPLRADKRWGS